MRNYFAEGMAEANDSTRRRRRGRASDPAAPPPEPVNVATGTETAAETEGRPPTGGGANGNGTGTDGNGANGDGPNGNDGGRSGKSLDIVPVAAAAASGIGVLGFVTFGGGVVLWRRFSEMGLPADDAVAEVPKSMLISTGADFLAPAFAFTALTVLALVIVKAVTPSWDGHNRLRFGLAVVFGIVVIVVNGYVAVRAKDQIGDPAFVGLLCIAAGGGVIVAISSCLLRHGAAIALVAFIATGTFWVARAYDKTSHNPNVVPMAYSRVHPGTPPSVETGYLVAETSDRIWFASLPQSNTNELREFPRNETDDLELGQLTSIPNAQRRAALFVANLCHRFGILSAGSLSAHMVGQSPRRVRPASIPVGCSAFGGVHLEGDGAVASHAGILKVQVACPKAAVSRCVGILAVWGRKRVHGRGLGAAGLSLQAGRIALITVKLSKEGDKLIRRHAIKAIETASTRDATYHHATTAAKITITPS